jgi:ribulose-5-phosphate 4-epimerase/fuculose-1-phosphate aldolase
MNQPAFLSDIRKGYPELAPDTDYPPLTFASVKGRVSAAEWQARVDCACAYRLVAHFGMDDLIYNHISVKIPGTEEYLLNPFGLMYEEICASSLIKVDVEGRVLWSPEFPAGLPYQFNPAGFVIHGAIHAARPDVGAIIHTHSLATMAISALDSGLLPITQTSMRFATIGYHDYEGVVLTLDERDRLLANMAEHEVMFLRNHGVLAIGAGIAQAFNNTYRVERSCRAQLMAQSCNAKLVLPPQDVIAKTNHAYKPGTRRPYGVLEWPAMRRLADRLDPSYKN